MINRIKKFFSESKQELRQVQWPSRKEAIRLTGVVISISLILAVFWGAFDLLFSYLLRTLIALS